jgi:hypothetical protein
MGGSSPTTSTTTNKIPEHMEKYGKAITEKGMALPTSYTAQDVNAPINSGYQSLASGIDQAKNAFTPWQAQAGTAASSAYDKNQVGGPQFSQANFDKFTNPFESQVISGLQGDAEKNLKMGLNANRTNAASAGAFGGGRHGVVDAVTTSNVTGDLNNRIAALRSGNFDNSVNNIFRENAATNAAAGQNYNQGMGYAGEMAKLGQMGVDNLTNGNNAAFALTNTLQGLDQGAFDRTVAENKYAATAPYEFLQRQAAINAGSPYTQISTSTQTQPNNMLGTGLYAAGSMLPMLSKMPMFAAMSDERAKENIRDLDPEHILGAFSEIPTKSYEYKPEYRDSPTAGHGRRDGFMAQDYERAFGHQSPEIGGVKHIDVPQLLGRVVTAIKGLEARTRPLKRRTH